jgi:Flp pilus assembly protein TadD
MIAAGAGVALIYRSLAARRAQAGSASTVTAPQRAVPANPTSADDFNERGLAKIAKSDLDGAIADFTRAIELDPKQAAVYYTNRANVICARPHPASAGSRQSSS